MRSMFQAPGVQVVALVPVAGPVPPPIKVVRPLALAVADHLAAAKLDLLAVDGEVLFDLDDQFRVGKANAVAGGGTVVAGVGGSGQAKAHGAGPRSGTSKPTGRRPWAWVGISP